MIMPRFKDGSKIIQSRLAVVERQPKKTIVFLVLSIVLLGLSFYIGKEAVSYTHLTLPTKRIV